MLLINGRILTCEGPNIECGYLRTDGEKIVAVGEMGEIGPVADEKVLDCRGKLVMPGMIDAHCHLGMWEDGLGFEGDDGNESTDPVTPQLRAIDGINPMERSFAEALQAGVTTVVTGPGSSNPVAGRICAMKTYGCRVDDMLLGEVGVKFSLGENPKATYSEKSQTPITRMAVTALIREALQKAQRYLQDTQRAREEEEDPPEYDAKCEALLPLLRREMKAHFHVHRADDIFTALRIAREFSLDALLIHATEGYLVADVLQREGAQVVCGPVIGARTKPELRNHSRANAAVLAAHGVEAAICTDHPEMPIDTLALCAGLAAAEGLSKMAAIRAITILPARMAGIENRVGSLVPGKDADILVFSRDPLALGVRPEQVIAGGVLVEDAGR